MSKKSLIEARENRVNNLIEGIQRHYTHEFSEGLVADGVPGPVLNKCVKRIEKAGIAAQIENILHIQGYPSGEGFWLAFLRWENDHQPKISDGAEIY